ncbi:MAG: hypothetical protein RLZZ267_126 [Bacillota bacterium]|jgi:alpha-beta hydrolase superfamily lysophospholipase
MKVNRSWQEMQDGTRVFLYTWIPTEEIKGIVQIVHGMAEHALRYERLAWEMVEQGYAVYAHDQRGHGQTARSIENLGNTSGADFHVWVDDVHQIQKQICSEHDHGIPRYLFGHSMGSFIALRYSQLHGHHINGLILSGSNGKPSKLLTIATMIANMQINYYGPEHPSRLLDKLLFGRFNSTFEPSRTRFDWLSRDSQEVDAYIADPYCGFVCSALFYRDFFEGLHQTYRTREMKKLPRSLPVYILSGDHDPVGECGKGVARLIKGFNQLGLKNVRFMIYKNARHELINDLQRKQVSVDLLSWLGEI